MFRRRTPLGRITRPSQHSSVPRLFQAQGSIEGLPPGRFLFLVVIVEGLLWPKSDVRLDGASWTAEVHEEGSPPGGNFSLSLYSVGRIGHDEIRAWLDRGQSTGHYPGLRQIKDGARLHTIKLKLQPATHS
jgi:hypothetical protein